MTELEEARQRLRRLERRLELLLLGGLKDGLQDPSAVALVSAICEQKSTVEKLEEATMADDKTKTGKPDRDRINTSDPSEVRDWAKKFGVSEERLVYATTKVGPMAKDVARELGKNL